MKLITIKLQLVNFLFVESKFSDNKPKNKMSNIVCFNNKQLHTKTQL